MFCFWFVTSASTFYRARELTSRHVALWGMCYIHVNNIHYAVIVIFKQKIKLFKNGNPTRKTGGNMLGHISTGKQEPVFGEDESNR